MIESVGPANPRYSLPAFLGKTLHEAPLDAANAIIGAMELAGLDLIIREPDELLAAIESVGPEQAAAELRYAADLLDSISVQTEKEAA